MSLRQARLLAISGTVMLLVLTAAMVFLQDRFTLRSLQGQVYQGNGLCFIYQPTGNCPSDPFYPIRNGPYCERQENEPCGDVCYIPGTQVPSPFAHCARPTGSSFLYCTTCERCGDAILQYDEQCDDGNAVNGDGCSDACRTEGSSQGSTGNSSSVPPPPPPPPPPNSSSSVAPPPPSSPSSSSIPPTPSSSSVCSNCVTVSSSSGPSQGSSTNPPPPSSASSCSSFPPVVCPEVPPSCYMPTNAELEAIRVGCIQGREQCMRNAYPSSIRLPSGCQYQIPADACMNAYERCLCNLGINYQPNLCPSSSSASSRSSSSASTVACPEKSFCGTTQECAQSNAVYVMPPSFCGAAEDGTHCCIPEDNECPEPYVCMDKQVCLDEGGVNNGQGMCGGTDSTTCCDLPDNSSSSKSSTGEEWVFTACPNDTQADPVLCVMAPPGNQVCPTSTVRVGGTCKNTKYQNGTLVAQQVGICCGPTNTPSSGSSRSSSSSTTSTGVACCMPPLNYSCLQVATNALCTGAQGMPYSTMQQCNLNCHVDSSSSKSSSSSRPSSSPSSSSSRSSSSTSVETCVQFGNCPSSSSSSSRSSSSSSSVTTQGVCCEGGDFCNPFGTCSNPFPNYNACTAACGGPSSSSSRSSSSVIVVYDPPSSSSTPFLECNGDECRDIGDAFCGLQNLSCIPENKAPCFRCGTVNSSSSSGTACTENHQCPSGICLNGTCVPPNSSSSAQSCTENYQCPSGICFNGTCTGCTNDAQCPDALVCRNGECIKPPVLGCLSDRDCPVGGLCLKGSCYPCTENRQCQSNLCVNGLCLNINLPDGAACTDGIQCLSGLCINNVCTSKSTLPATSNQSPIALDPVTGKPLLSASHDPLLTLPATVIELPFMNGDQMADIRSPISGTNDAPRASAPATPSTGPAALAVMLAGGAAGWLYRRRR